MVEVFKTNVKEEKDAILLIQKLAEHFPKHKINFDLSDCDNILRVQGKYISPEKAIEVLASTGYICQVLE